MKYLPFENITYKTKLESEEILKRVAGIIEPKKNFRISGLFGGNNNKPYEGSIGLNSFKINKIIGHQNSFLPRIKGKIVKDFNGTQVNVKMKLSIFVIAFMCVWFGGVIVGCFVGLSSFLDSTSFEPMALIPFGMLIFGYALVTVGFKYESVKSKKYFAELFEARIKE
ncbi:hypothetical protein [Lacinutrix sp.]|uniref:hypothetical protein n=1 Tax=Lacinutrix sp. TaxID=1937692 RepID=UPI0025BCE7EC|nr:hypothetical protein [Lacinutrix sp.]